MNVKKNKQKHMINISKSPSAIGLYKSCLLRAAVRLAMICFFLQSLSAATLRVKNLNDSGPGSLREKLEIAASGDTIVFSHKGTIVLSSPLIIDQDVTIAGPGQDKLIIDGQNSTLIFAVLSGVTAKITDITITRGYNDVFGPGGSGGAIHNTGNLVLKRCVVSESTSEFGVGGGIGSAGNLTVVQCSISNNFAMSGGGIGDGPGLLVVDRSTINANLATEPGGGFGGGIFKAAGSGELVNSTISGNQALNGNGGGIWTHGHLAIESSTIVSNQAVGLFFGNYGQGGGIFMTTNGSVAMRNTIVAGNTSTLGVPPPNEVSIGPDIFGLVLSQGWNLIQNPADAITTGVLSGNIIGQDPLLGPLEDNGGPTLTHALLVQSPAIDHGSPSSFPPTDQRGVLRPQDGNRDGVCISDIGAYERCQNKKHTEKLCRHKPCGTFHWNDALGILNDGN